MSRSNWTGAEEAHDDAGLPASVHGLGPATWLRAHPPPRPVVEANLAAPEAFVELHDAAEPHEEHAPDEVAPEERQLNADAAQPAAERQVPVSLFRQEKDVHITSTTRWILTGSMPDDVFIGRRLARMYGKVIKHQLKMGGVQWEREQQRKVPVVASMRQGRP